MRSLVTLLLLCRWTTHGRLKYVDNMSIEIKHAMDLSMLEYHRSIIIEKEREMHYNRNVTELMKQCSGQLDQLDVADVNINYLSCAIDDAVQRVVKVIPAADESDLYETGTYLHGNYIRPIRPFAPHLIILEDVALYGRGDVIGLDGTSHYLGSCRQYGAPGFENINLKRKRVMFFNETVVNMVTLWTDNYFNTLVGYIPRVLSLMALLDKNPGLKVLKNMYPSKAESFIAPILEYYDMHPKKFNLVNIEYGKVHFAKYLISPISSCKFIPRQFVKMIRAAVTDLYKVDTSEELRAIVVSDRRELDPVCLKMKELYGQRFEIVRYNLMSSINSDDADTALEQTAKLFARCRLFLFPLGPGAGLTNVMFMSRGAAVVEIRPESERSLWYYSYLSSTVGVQYHTFRSSSLKMGAKIKFDLHDLLSTVHQVLFNEPLPPLNIIPSKVYSNQTTKVASTELSIQFFDD